MVKRSNTNKQEFLKSQGLNKIPKGYQIDHIKPLSEGRSYDLNNMQLISVEQHKRKTARERNGSIIFLANEEVLSFKRVYEANEKGSEMNFPGMENPSRIFELIKEFTES